MESRDDLMLLLLGVETREVEESLEVETGVEEMRKDEIEQRPELS